MFRQASPYINGVVQIRTGRGHERYAFMTVLCDHEYLRGIQEKIRLIRDFERAEMASQNSAA